LLGHPRLREHLSAIVALMKLSQDYDDFVAKLNITHPICMDETRDSVNLKETLV